MKLVQKSLTRWISAIYAIAIPLSPQATSSTATAQSAPRTSEYLRHFDPARGFKPAQANLTEVFLQQAESLEHHGSPEPYIRHMQAEHQRISALYEKKTGKPHVSLIPTHMTEAYIERLVQNWNTLSAPLGLEPFAKEIGGHMREGIMGTRLSGTLAVQIFNDHQELVAAKMWGDSNEPAGFEQLRARLQRDLEFGKDNIDTRGYETTRRDAVSYSSFIDGAFRKKFKAIDAAAKPDKAKLIKEVVAGVFLDLGHMAQSELEIGILESALNHPGFSRSSR